MSNVAALWSITTILSELPLGFVTSIFCSQMIAGNLSCSRFQMYLLTMLHAERVVFHCLGSVHQEKISGCCVWEVS